MYLYKKIAITDRALFFKACRERFETEKENCKKKLCNEKIYNEKIYKEKIYKERAYNKEIYNKNVFREVYNKEIYNKEAYIEHLVKLTQKVNLIILREKNLDIEEYKNLAQNLLAVLENKERLILHTHIEIALQINLKKIHLPFNIFCENLSFLHKFGMIGVSVHSLEEAYFAEQNGADYIIAGHIFQTQCKKDLKPKGLDFLKNICENIKIPVYALGGITKENELDTIRAGALGACRMSDYMKDISYYNQTLFDG